MSLKLPLLATTAALALSACTIPENPAVTEARNTCATAYADPQLDPVRHRIPFGDNQASMASMAQLADTQKPNNIERVVLQIYDNANRRCWDAWDRVGTSPYIQQARTQVSTALAELVSGQSTFGDYNRKRATAVSEMNARLREAEDRQRAAWAFHNRVMYCDSWGPRGYGYRQMHCF